MSLTLTVSDLENGSQALAQISGSAGGTVQVFTQNVDGELGGGAWTLAGGRVGNGPLTLNLFKGYFFAYAREGTNLSGVVYFRVSQGTDSVASRVEDAIRSRLKLLNLPCTARVYTSQFELPPQVTYPCIILTTEKERPSDESVLSTLDDIGHPYRILVKDVCFRFDDSARRTYRAWSQAIRRAFVGQRLPGVTESVINKVDFGEVARVSDGEGPQVVVEILLRVITREPRGLGA